jgi:uridylate kinase
MYIRSLMTNSPKRDKIIFSIGGSVLCPGKTKDLYDYEYIDKLVSFVSDKISEDTAKLFFLVTGGGALARLLQGAGRERPRPLTDLQKDWLGIHATRANAQVLKTEFEVLGEELVHPHIIKHYEDIIRKIKPSEQVVCAAGWKPGRSTDYCAVQLCEDYMADVVINLTNIPQVYDKDPNVDPQAKPIDKMTWSEYREQIVGMDAKWQPGLNSPFDPVAAEFAQRLVVKVVVLDGHNLDNLADFMAGKSFIGTVIEPG